MPSSTPKRGNAAVHTARGWALENLGPERLGDARAAYEQALALNDGAMWAKEGLANVMRRMGHTDEADRLCVEVIEEGRRRYHDEEDLWELVGWCELRLGRYDDAVAHAPRSAAARRPVDRGPLRPRARAAVLRRPRRARSSSTRAACTRP